MLINIDIEGLVSRYFDVNTLLSLVLVSRNFNETYLRTLTQQCLNERPEIFHMCQLQSLYENGYDLSSLNLLNNMFGPAKSCGYFLDEICELCGEMASFELVQEQKEFLLKVTDRDRPRRETDPSIPHEQNPLLVENYFNWSERKLLIPYFNGPDIILRSRNAYVRTHTLAYVDDSQKIANRQLIAKRKRDEKRAVKAERRANREARNATRLQDEDEMDFGSFFD